MRRGKLNGVSLVMLVLGPQNSLDTLPCCHSRVSNTFQPRFDIVCHSSSKYQALH